MARFSQVLCWFSRSALKGGVPLTLLAAALLLSPTPARAQPITAFVTADNAYEIYCRDSSGAITDLGGSTAFTSAAQIYSAETYNFNCDGCAYIAAWSDDGYEQGLLAQLDFGGMTILSGDPGWWVCGTGIDLDGLDPAPSVADLDTQIATCDSGSSWQAVTVGEDNSSSGGVFGIVSPGAAANEWMWYESGNCAGSGSPFDGGCNHDEFLIFSYCPGQGCGNNVTEFGEECDGTDLGSCPVGPCKDDCSCPTPHCGNNVVEPGEECDGSDDTLCPGQCLKDCTCARESHMQCYDMKDAFYLKKFLAYVDLDSPQFGIDYNCEVKKALRFCTPTIKIVNSATLGGNPLALNPISGPALTTDFICYKLKCKEPPDPPDWTVGDQFKYRDIRIKKTKELCVPAIKKTACEDSGAPQCFGICPDPLQVCSQSGSTGDCACQ